MHTENFQAILSRVNGPSRYAGNEINAVHKDPDQAGLSFALVFPDLYEIGTSHFGLQILYTLLNRRHEIVAERFYCPAPDMAALMADRQIPCLSMESRKPLATFDIIGISLLYELNFTNILTMLSLSGIPFYAAERSPTFPLLIGGGPCAFNPEPLADFFDAFVIGDGEEAALQISDTVMAFTADGDGGKSTLLSRLSRIPGVYVPSLYAPGSDQTGPVAPLDARITPHRIKRAFLPELTRENFPATPIVPFGKPVHDRLRLEIARGCTRGCRFCQAGMIYRPVRERSLTDLIEIADASLAATGYEDISLLSLSTGDYSRLPELMANLMITGQQRCHAVSLPSIRAERLTPELMTLIKRVRKTGFTIAPEAGTQTLRDIINKTLTEADIRAAVKNAFDLGWHTIKLYFMIGLPCETDRDIQGIRDLSTRLATDFAGKKGRITVNVTPFIPKPHTPFQHVRQLPPADALHTLDQLQKTLRHPRVHFKWQDPRMSLVEGVFARGDRRLSRLLHQAFNNGCRLDGWQEHFDFDAWQAAFDRTGIDPETYTSPNVGPEGPFAWDHIDSGVSRQFLTAEWEKASARGGLTPDCRDHGCTGCGVCDFTTIRPVLHTAGDPDSSPSPPTPPAPASDIKFARFSIGFSKLDEARFFGHLELATIFQRAVRRAGLTARYSEGFHPAMKLSFDNALPVGMESESEICHIFLDTRLRPMTIKTALNRQLPSGLTVTRCEHAGTGKKNDDTAAATTTYQIRLDGLKGTNSHDLTAPAVKRFLALPDFWVEDLTKKGKIRKTDLRQSVTDMHFTHDTILEMTMTPYNGRHIRPAAVLKAGFGFSENAVQTLRIKKMA